MLNVKKALSLIVGMFLIVSQAISQTTVAGFDKDIENYLVSEMKAGRSESVGQWARENPTLINKKGPQGLTPLILAIKHSALYSFIALLDAGADSNTLLTMDGTSMDPMLLVHMFHSANESKMRNFAQVLLSHGYRWDNINVVNGTQMGLAAAFILSVEESSGTVAQFIWLAEKGMNISDGVKVPGAGIVSLREISAQMGKNKFASSIQNIIASSEAVVAANEESLDLAFTQKGIALGTYFGIADEENNIRLLKNPNAFQPGAGYYYGNVIPYQWMTREKVVCYTEDLSIIGNKGRSELFLVYIEDPELRRSFTPSTMTVSSDQTLTIGFDVILVPYEDAMFNTWPGFKLIAMKQAKIIQGVFKLY